MPSTLDSIVYDEAVLNAADTNSLLRQICYRLDRQTPKAQDDVNTVAAVAAAEALINGYAAELTAAGFPNQAAAMLAVIQ